MAACADEYWHISHALWEAIASAEYILHDALLLERFSPSLGEDWDADLALLLRSIPRGRVGYSGVLQYVLAQRGLGVSPMLFVPTPAFMADLRAAFTAVRGEWDSRIFAQWSHAVHGYTSRLLDYGVEKGLLERTASGRHRHAPKRGTRSQELRKKATAHRKYVQKMARHRLTLALTQLLGNANCRSAGADTVRVRGRTIMALMQGKHRVTPARLKKQLQVYEADEDIIKAAMAIYKESTHG
jgi:hypothetical protein